MRCGRDIPVRAVLRRIVLMWAFRLKISCRRGGCRRRIARRRARAPVSRTVVSTPTAALHAARGAARPDIPTPVRLLSMRRRARRHFQISSRNAAISCIITVSGGGLLGLATRRRMRALMQSTEGGARTRRHTRALLQHSPTNTRARTRTHTRTVAAFSDEHARADTHTHTHANTAL